MIGVVDVKIQAHNPEMPLFPMKAFAGSPSSIRVRNVPSQIGKWKITGVTFSVVYPDGQVVPTDCVSINNIWVGTVPGTQATGRTINGYTIFASGKDENGNTVQNYALGKGDVEILDPAGVSDPTETIKFVTEDEISSVVSVAVEEQIHQIVGEDYYQKTETSSAVELQTQFAKYYLKSETSSSTEIFNGLKTVENKLSGYYPKTETSSATEISEAINGVEEGLSAYYLKSETSSSTEITEAIQGVENSLTAFYPKTETSSATELTPEFVKSKYYRLVENAVLSGMNVEPDKYPIVLTYSGNGTPETYTFTKPFSPCEEDNSYTLFFVEITADTGNYLSGDVLIGIDGWSTATVVNASGQTDQTDWSVTFSGGTIVKSNILPNINYVQLFNNAENIVSIENTADLVYYSFPDGIVNGGNRYAIDLLINLNLVSCSTAPEAVYMYKSNGGNYTSITSYSDDGSFPETAVSSTAVARTLFGFTELSEGQYAVSGKKLEVVL